MNGIKLLPHRLFLIISMCYLPLSSFALNSNEFTITPEMCNAAKQLHQQQSLAKSIPCKTYIQTTSYTCGPAVVMTILNFYGRLGGRSMSKETEMQIAKEMGASKRGTSLSQVANWLRNNGFNVTTGSSVTTALIVRNLNRGIPTIVGLNNHWLVAKAYNKGSAHTYKNQNQIIFSDSCCGTSSTNEETIDTAWGAAQIKNNSCNVQTGQYIIATPR